MTLVKFGYRHGDRTAAPQAFPCCLCDHPAKDGYLYANREAQQKVICRRCLAHIRQSIAEYDQSNPGLVLTPWARIALVV